MYKSYHKRSGLLAPDPEMWEALSGPSEGDGRGLWQILNRFYELVYADERLAPFFEGVTRQRAIEKQFSFLRSIFTGEKCYFGQHPRNAHHWMVVSDELFDYRENLMRTCLQNYGLSDELIDRWGKIEDVFRSVIVKSDPVSLKFGGVTRQADNYTNEVVEVDTVCDDCCQEIAASSSVLLHHRTGKVYCKSCSTKYDIAQDITSHKGTVVPDQDLVTLITEKNGLL